MKDLTHGSIPKHLIALSVPIAAGMVFQTLYYLVDLYFVSGCGDDAIAGVSAAGTVSFVILALTQVLGVGTVALVAHASGRKDRAEATLIFNQSMALSAICGVVVLVAGYSLSGAYMRAVAAAPAAAAAGATYLRWFTPALALQFALVAMGAALRGTGIVKPTMIVQILTVVLNIALAPILIAGWGTHAPLGVAGAGLASSLSIAAGVAFLSFYFAKLELHVTVHASQWRPRLSTVKRILNVGLPAGGEFFILFVVQLAVYRASRVFGPTAQAGFGIGFRVVQAALLPALAIALGASPLAGQNFGAKNAARVKETFRTAITLSTALMLVATILCHLRPAAVVGGFARDPAAVAVGAGYLTYVSWNFVASGIVFSCSSLFQAMGHTWPSLLSSALRLVTFVAPVLWLSARPGFALEQVWALSVASVALQAITSGALLRREFRRTLDPLVAPPAATELGVAAE